MQQSIFNKQQKDSAIDYRLIIYYFPLISDKQIKQALNKAGAAP